jgi:hypothetical protein
MPPTPVLRVMSCRGCTRPAKSCAAASRGAAASSAQASARNRRWDGGHHSLLRAMSYSSSRPPCANSQAACAMCARITTSDSRWRLSYTSFSRCSHWTAGRRRGCSARARPPPASGAAPGLPASGRPGAAWRSSSSRRCARSLASEVRMASSSSSFCCTRTAWASYWPPARRCRPAASRNSRPPSTRGSGRWWPGGAPRPVVGQPAGRIAER